MPCAAPVRSSEIVSPIIFCRPINTSATETECSDCTAKKPGMPRPSGHTSGKAIHRTMAPIPAITMIDTTENELKKRVNIMNMQTSDTTPHAHRRPTTESLMPIDFQ